MPTNTAIITDALQKARIADANTAADAVALADGLDLLNRMMALWAVSDKDIGFFPQDTLADTCPIPTWAEQAVVSNLALKCCGAFHVPATPELITEAIEDMQALARICINHKLEKSDMDHMPIGSGYGRYDIESDTF